MGGQEDDQDRQESQTGWHGYDQRVFPEIGGAGTKAGSRRKTAPGDATDL